MQKWKVGCQIIHGDSGGNNIDWFYAVAKHLL
jgi:hypothetical protein